MCKHTVHHDARYFKEMSYNNASGPGKRDANAVRNATVEVNAKHKALEKLIVASRIMGTLAWGFLISALCGNLWDSI